LRYVHSLLQTIYRITLHVMARIIIRNLLNRVIEVAGQSSTLLQAIQQEGIDWMHACGGKGRCTTCKVMVLNGTENLADPTEAEERYREQGTLGTSERLTCQAKIIGDVSIAVPEECKLPHVKYND
jgi:2Fe-2S ferredoxin